MDQNLPLAICYSWFLLLLVHSCIASFYFTKGKGQKVVKASTALSLVLASLAVIYGVLVYMSVLSGQSAMAQSLVVPGIIVVAVTTSIGEAVKALGQRVNE
jgi:hypothetical protein